MSADDCKGVIADLYHSEDTGFQYAVAFVGGSRDCDTKLRSVNSLLL